jgi:glyoxylase-like metal-dependent hydrolase (beta-lactamase superfamily II)
MEIIRFSMGGLLKNLSYLLICKETGKAALLDPGSLSLFPSRQYGKILSCLSGNNYSLQYIINTHRHFDHTRGNRYFSKRTGATVLSYQKGLREKDIISIGKTELLVMETPGHTADGICLFGEGNLFTGDTLFAGDSGATVSRDSDRPALGRSLRKLIQDFPSETVVRPGHIMNGRSETILGREQKSNVNAEEYKLGNVSYSGNIIF